MYLLLLGLIPLLLGYLMNSWLMENQNSVLPFKLIGLILLAFWLGIGFISYKFEKSSLKSSIIVHLPALFILLLIMFQEFILGHYWSNFLGTATQFYYLPLINLSSSIVWIFRFLTSGIWLISLVAFLLMFASYYLGNYLNKFRNNQ